MPLASKPISKELVKAKPLEGNVVPERFALIMEEVVKLEVEDSPQKMVRSSGNNLEMREESAVMVEMVTGNMGIMGEINVERATGGMGINIDSGCVDKLVLKNVDLGARDLLLNTLFVISIKVKNSARVTGLARLDFTRRGASGPEVDGVAWMREFIGASSIDSSSPIAGGESCESASDDVVARVVFLTFITFLRRKGKY
ncbi:hypothetical protein ACLOJK_001875 [Asimina triloba]